MLKTEEKFIDKDIRPTAMRLLVYKYLVESETALSLSDLETYFEKSDKTTPYRTLKTFEQKNLVRSIDDGSGGLNTHIVKIGVIVICIVISISILIVPNAILPFVYRDKKYHHSVFQKVL